MESKAQDGNGDSPLGASLTWTNQPTRAQEQSGAAEAESLNSATLLRTSQLDDIASRLTPIPVNFLVQNRPSSDARGFRAT
jgi:hypothetical protein